MNENKCRDIIVYNPVFTLKELTRMQLELKYQEILKKDNLSRRDLLIVDWQIQNLPYS